MNVQAYDPKADPTEVEIAVIGGGVAGLAAGLQLARQERSVLVLDAGEPRNAPADHLHGYLGWDGAAPADLQARGRAEVEGYGATVRSARVVRASAQGEEAARRITLELETGATVRARAVVLATGLIDVLPSLLGDEERGADHVSLHERWGKDVLHCPYCHGWEVRGSRIGILASSSNATHQALLFARLAKQPVVITHGSALAQGVEGSGADVAVGDGLGEGNAALLRAAGVEIVEGPVRSLTLNGGRLSGVKLANGDVLPLDALAVQTRMEARLAGLESLGLEVSEHPSGMGTFVAGGFAGATSVPGVWVAGNVSDPGAQLGAAAAAGAFAGAGVNAALTMEDAQAALTAQVAPAVQG